jgi:hypothetical protein
MARPGSPPGQPNPRALVNREDVLIRAISALVAALASAGFVAAVGGAILWARFQTTELPAEQAVAAVPNEELVVVGAVALVGFLIAAIAAVLGVYVLDTAGTAGARTRRGLIALMVVEIAIAIFFVESGLGTRLLLGAAFAVAGVLIVYLLDAAADTVTAALAAPVSQRPNWLEQLRGWAGDQLFRGVGGWEGQRRVIAMAVLVAGVFVAAKADDLIWVVLWLAAVLVFVQPLKALFWGHDGLRRVVAVALIAYGLTALIRFHESLAEVTIAAVSLALLNLGVAKTTGNRFAFYGVSVFLSVVLFGGILSYVRTRDYPKLQSVAVLMKDGESVCGLYVTETDSRLYLARVDVVGGRGRKVSVVERSGRIFWLPRDQIERSELGPLQGVIPAQANAADLREELVSEHGNPPPSGVAGVLESSECSPPPTFLPPKSTEQRELAERLQPRLVVHRGDGFWPISALTIFRLRHGEDRTRRQVTDDESIVTTRVNQLPWVGGVNEWLDYPGPNTRKGEQHEDMVKALKANLNSEDPAKTAREYFFVVDDEEGQLTSLQYWFYYQFNYQNFGIRGVRVGTAGFHEGDFESIGVLLSRNKEPKYVWMARHAADEGRPFAWREPILKRSGEHLTVYAARGSHATYETCGVQHRQERARGLINDETACGSDKLVFEPQITPLSDLAFAPWACWQGHFGYSRLRKSIAAEQYLIASGPASPLWQQKLGDKTYTPCATVEVPPLRPGVRGEETIDDATAGTLRQNGGQLQLLFDSCDAWRKPPTRGVYVVACNDEVLDTYFESGLEEVGDERIRIRRQGGRARPLTVPAIYRSPDLVLETTS